MTDSAIPIENIISIGCMSAMKPDPRESPMTPNSHTMRFSDVLACSPSPGLEKTIREVHAASLWLWQGRLNYRAVTQESAANRVRNFHEFLFIRLDEGVISIVYQGRRQLLAVGDAIILPGYKSPIRKLLSDTSML